MRHTIESIGSRLIGLQPSPRDDVGDTEFDLGIDVQRLFDIRNEVGTESALQQRAAGPDKRSGEDIDHAVEREYRRQILLSRLYFVPAQYRSQTVGGKRKAPRGVLQYRAHADDGTNIQRILREILPDSRSNGADAAKRAGRLEQCDGIDVAMRILEPSQRMLQNGRGACLIGGQMRRAHPGNAPAVPSCIFGDIRIVRRYQDIDEPLACDSRLEGPSDQRSPTHELHILPMNTLAISAGGYDAENPGRTIRFQRALHSWTGTVEDWTPLGNPCG